MFVLIVDRWPELTLRSVQSREPVTTPVVDGDVSDDLDLSDGDVSDDEVDHHGMSYKVTG